MGPAKPETDRHRQCSQAHARATSSLNPRRPRRTDQMVRGRAALADEFATFLADPQLLRLRVTSAIDTGRTSFRFWSVVERRDGKKLEFFDAGEVDTTGRISLIVAFAGPLGAAAGSNGPFPRS